MMCYTCGTDKPLADMVYNATHGYYSSQCRDCKAEYLRQYRQRNKQRLRETAKRKYSSNPTPRKEYAVRWARDNRDRHNANTKRWRESNPDKHAQSVHNWDAAKRGASGSHTAQQWSDLKSKHDNRCVRCSEQRPLHRDHIIAPALGGTNNIDNIQPLCKSCNSKKGQKTTNYLNATHCATRQLLSPVQTSGSED